MEQFILEEDIVVYCITATSFPEGVKAAHETLHSLIPFDTSRKYFGLSRPENEGAIVYKAAAEELVAGELATHGLEKMTIQKGSYKSILIHNFMTDIPAIGNAFQQLIAEPDIAADGYCVEWYLNNDDVRCMVRLQS